MILRCDEDRDGVGFYKVCKVRDGSYKFVGLAVRVRVRDDSLRGQNKESAPTSAKNYLRELAKPFSNSQTEMIGAFLLQPHVARVIVGELDDQRSRRLG